MELSGGDPAEFPHGCHRPSYIPAQRSARLVRPTLTPIPAVMRMVRSSGAEDETRGILGIVAFVAAEQVVEAMIVERVEVLAWVEEIEGAVDNV